MTYTRPQRMKRNELTEFTLLHKEIQEMKDSTANELLQLRKATDRILRTLIGDEEMAQEGLVNKVQRHDEFIESQKLFWAKLSGIALAGGAFGGFILNMILKMF